MILFSDQQIHNEPFGSPANATGNMNMGYRGMSTWQDEFLQGFQLHIHSVHFFFQDIHICLVQVRDFHFGFLVGITGQCCSYGKEPVLNLFEHAATGFI